MIHQKGTRAPLQLPAHVRVRLEALATLMQLPNASVVERSLDALLATLSTDDRSIVERLACRALENSGEQSLSANGNRVSVHEARTVKGSPFKYAGSLRAGMEVFFPNSPSLRISADSIDRIRQEINEHKGPIRMGACLKPLVADSLGEALYRKHKLTPIKLSFVIPLLESEGFCSTKKEGRNWIVVHRRQ